jgi:hypothetical protein
MTERYRSPVNLLSRAGTFILVNRQKNQLSIAVHALSFPGLMIPVHLQSYKILPGYYTVSEGIELA